MQRWTLVTGASGFVGSRLVRELVKRGECVKGFVRAGSSLKPLEGLPSDRFELAYGDVLVEHTLYRALARCDRMYHLATNFRLWDANAEGIVGPAVEGTRAALEAARRRGLKKVVVTGSTAALGVSTEPAPFDEEHAFNLEDPEAYVRGKYEAYRVALELSARVPLVLVLPSTILGPGDWRPTPSGMLVVRYLRLPSTRRVPIMDGGMNIVDVDDVVNGHILAMERGSAGERYILGGEDLTFEQLFDTLSDVTGLGPAGKKQSPALLALVGSLLTLKARMFGGEPWLTRRIARDYAGKFVFVTSRKAERDLGYTHRPAREALARSVQWFLEKGFVPEQSARHVRLELKAA
jgi:dihydroflavonol-4-reductase